MSLIIDPSLLSDSFNVHRPQKLPYGIVMNKGMQGLLVPEDNLIKSEWIGQVTLTKAKMSKEVVVGLFLEKARIAIVGYSEDYMMYKSKDLLEDQGVDPALGGQLIGFYDRAFLNKKIHDAACDYLIVFLDEENNLLHKLPIRFRFKNVALWSFKSALRNFYSEIELTFSQLAQVRASNKDDRWRALAVFSCQFIGVEEGEGVKRSICCKVAHYRKPDADAFPELFLGLDIYKQQREALWQMYDLYSMNTTCPVQPQLPGGEQPKQLPAAKPTLALPSSDPYGMEEDDSVPY